MALGNKTKGNKGLGSLSAAGKVYTFLRDDIIHMNLKPGVQLKEKEIIERFSVSRTPVREACLQLASENLLDIRPQSGTVVSPIRLSVLWDAQFLRVAVEAAAIRKLASKITDEQLAALKEIIDEQEFCMFKNMTERFANLDEKFHDMLIEFAGHPNVCDVINVQKAHIDRIRYMSIPSEEHIKDVFKEHSLIFDALAKRSPKEAEKTLLTHLSTLPVIVNNLVEEQPEYFVIDVHKDAGLNSLA